MGKQVLIISTSFRKKSNSDTLANAFGNGAKEAGHTVEKVNLYGKTINFCKGCLACQKIGHCVIEDDANDITEKMLHADVIAFATPIYYYEMCGQMKTMLDRANSLYSSDYAFREIYLLAASAEEEKSSMDGAIKGLQGWIDCFEHAKMNGVVYGTGVNDEGAIKEDSEIWKAAYKMGQAV